MQALRLDERDKASPRMSPTCDYCSKSAVRNYQRIWHVFTVSRSGRYLAERVDYDLEEPVDDNNLHLCRQHEEAFLAGEL
jgi:hypothetical protein